VTPAQLRKEMGEIVLHVERVEAAFSKCVDLRLEMPTVASNLSVALHSLRAVHWAAGHTLTEQAQQTAADREQAKQAEAMMRGAEARARGQRRLMVFDWDKARQILEARGWPDAEAGLSSDWGCTGGQIVKDGKPYHDSYTYLASIWATPSLLIEGEEIECWVWEDECPHGWGSSTKWPEVRS